MNLGLNPCCTCRYVVVVVVVRASLVLWWWCVDGCGRVLLRWCDRGAMMVVVRCYGCCGGVVVMMLCYESCSGGAMVSRCLEHSFTETCPMKQFTKKTFFSLTDNFPIKICEVCGVWALPLPMRTGGGGVVWRYRCAR